MADDSEGFARDETRRAQERRSLRRIERPALDCRSDLCAPENFVRHPVADARETGLHENYRFDGRAGVAS